MRSAISTTALLLHQLHSNQFSRCFGGYNYLSGSARCATSASSLHRYLHQRHHLRLFQQFRQKITSMRTLINSRQNMRSCTPLQSSQFNHIYYFSTTISSSLSKSATFWRPNCDTQSQTFMSSTYVLLPLLLPRHSKWCIPRCACVFSPSFLFLTDLTRVFIASSSLRNCSSPTLQQKLQAVLRQCDRIFSKPRKVSSWHLMVLVNHWISFLSSLRSKYDQCLPRWYFGNSKPPLLPSPTTTLRGS